MSNNTPNTQQGSVNELHTCSICLEVIEVISYDCQSHTTTPCGHYFHKECLKTHITINSFTCPYCRSDITIFCDEVFGMERVSSPHSQSDYDMEDSYRLLCYWDEFKHEYG